MKTAYAYARFSSENQREESIEAQFYDIKKYAESEGILIKKYFSDEAISGRTAKRPDFQAMLDKVYNEGNIDYIIVHKVDRFSRDKYHSAIIKEKLSRRGVRVLYAAQRISDTPEGGLMESILEGFADYYSKNLSAETKKGLYTNARKARFNGGVIPFGFDVDENKHYVINEYEAIAVKLIFDLYLSGLSQSKVADEINHRGYKTRMNRKFTEHSIKNILTNPKYCGTYEFGRLKFSYGPTGKRTTKTKRTDGDIIQIDDAIPAIIEKETFNKVQKAIKNRSNFRRPGQRVTYALKGKVICSCCGGNMTGYTSGKNGKYSYYRCKKCGNRIRKPALENYILTVAKSYMLKNEDKLVKLIEKEVSKLIGTKDADKMALKKRYDQIEREENNCVEFITQMGASEKLKEKLDALEAEKKEIEEKLKVELDPINFSKEIRLWFRKIKDEESGTVLSKRDIIQLMVDRVEVGDEEVKIFFNFCPPRGITPACAGTSYITSLN